MVVEVARVVVDIVAALVAAVDMDLAVGCPGVHGRPLYLDSILVLPSRVTSKGVCKRRCCSERKTVRQEMFVGIL